MTAVELFDPAGGRGGNALPRAASILLPSERPVPSPRRGEVLIRVDAAGVNRLDDDDDDYQYDDHEGYSDRQDNPGPSTYPTNVPGVEVAGTVVAMGSSQTGGRHGVGIGSRVCALLPDASGGYAQYCIAPSNFCLPIPDGLTAAEAATLPHAMIAAWEATFLLGRLQPGETLLVHVGSHRDGGAGAAAIQLASRLGAGGVYATAATEQECSECELSGAGAAIMRGDYYRTGLDGLTGGRPVDLIVDAVGGDFLNRNLESLATNGRLVQLALHPGHGTKAEVELRPILQKRLSIIGCSSTRRRRRRRQQQHCSLDDGARIVSALRQNVWPLLNAGAVRPILHRQFELECAADAHKLMETERTIGKIVLTIKHKRTQEISEKFSEKILRSMACERSGCTS